MWCLWYKLKCVVNRSTVWRLLFSLLKKYLGPSIICIDVGSDRVCCIKLNTKIGMLYIFNVYMPCDTTSNDHIIMFCLVYLHVYTRMKWNIVLLQAILIQT